MHAMIGSISLRVRTNRALTLINRSNSNGDIATLSVLHLLPSPPIRCLSNSVHFRNRSLLRTDSRALHNMHNGGVTVVFRRPVISLGPLRALRGRLCRILSLRHKVHQRTTHNRVLGYLSHINVHRTTGQLASCPRRLSNNRHRQIVVTVTLLAQPRLLVTSRPAATLSISIRTRVLRLLHRLRNRLGVNVLFVARGLDVIEGLTRHITMVRGNHYIRRGCTTALFTSPARPCARGLLGDRPSNSPIPLPRPTSALLSIRRLRITFPVHGKVLGHVISRGIIIGGVDFALQTNRALNLINRSNSKGDAAKLTLLQLVGSRNDVVFSNRPLRGLGHHRLLPVHRHVRIMFRSPGSSLGPQLGILRVVRRNLQIRRPALSTTRHRRRIVTIVRRIKLSPRAHRHCPTRFSNNRQRHVTVTETLVLGPSLVVLSRPASSLSGAMRTRVLALLGSLRRGRRLTCLFVDRSLRIIHTLYRRIVMLQRKRMIRRKPYTHIFTAPRRRCAHRLLTLD